MVNAPGRAQAGPRHGGGRAEGHAEGVYAQYGVAERKASGRMCISSACPICGARSKDVVDVEPIKAQVGVLASSSELIRSRS